MRDLAARSLEVEREIKRHALIALAVGVVPVPLVDLAALAGIQLQLVRRLARTYEVEFASEAGRSAITVLVGATYPVSVSAHLASLAKGIPAVGMLLGGAGLGAIGAASTYGIGKVFKQHFESGSTMLTFDPEKVRAYYAEQVARGRVEVLRSYAGIEP